MAKRNFSSKRNAIYNAVCGTDTHPSARWVYDKLKPEIPDLSLGTVYRNIALFKDEGKVSVICNVNGEERIDGNTEPHPHFVCNKCNAVIDVEDNQNADDLESQLAEEGFKVENRSTTAYVLNVRQKYTNIYYKGEVIMKWYCTVCGYVYEGPEAPEACPVCKAPKEKFKQMDEEASFATVHEVGVAQGVSEDILKDLRANFEGECSEVGMYLAMARVADREGYPEVSAAFTKYAFEEAEHAAKFAELLGEVLTDSTKKNLQMRVDAETGACEGKFDLAKRAKAQNLDAIHDTVHEMAKDEARHGAGFRGLLNRYFK